MSDLSAQPDIPEVNKDVPPWWQPHSLFVRLHRQQYLPFSFVTWFLIIVNLAALNNMAKHGFFILYGPLDFFWIVVCSFIPAFIWPAVISTWFKRSRCLQTVLNISLMLIMVSISIVSSRIHIQLSYSLLAENADELFCPESLKLIRDHLTVVHFIFLGGLLIWLFYASLWTKLFFKPKDFPTSWKQIGVISMLFLFGFLSPGYRANEGLFFVRSVAAYYSGNLNQVSVPVGEYPYVKPVTILSNTEKELHPHIFIIAVESFNARFLHGQRPDGMAYMPFLCSLEQSSLSIDPFYGNSVQTCRGHLSILASILPSARGKTFQQHEDIRINTLASILKRRDYRTVLWKSAYNAEFDNLRNFMLKHGFDEVCAMDAAMSEGIDEQFKWKWGVRDRYAYERMFRYIDETETDQQVFCFVPTITSHYPFNHMPIDQRLVYPDANKPEQHMANSMYLVDQDLKYFFEELAKRPKFKDSLVIITGDHSFPVGEHGITINGNGFYEEFFKIPLIMNWPGQIQPQKISEPFSQIDILPSICELMHIVEPNHFLGHSFLSEGNPNPIWLIQPYAGTYLCTVNKGRKYVFHVQSGEELMYDLASDSQELNNMFESLSETEKQEARQSLQQIYLNQYLIKQDQIWPPDQP